MQIGPYQLESPVILAPMAGITDLPYRSLCRRLGAGMAVSEMVSSNSLLWGSTKTKRRAAHQGEPEPRSVQILGADPKMMAEAARYNVELGAQIIDINMGCPAKKVCKTDAGSALLRNPYLVDRILRSVVAAVEVPVTLKIRTGWDEESRNGVTIARIAEAAGVAALAVHGRTRACGYRGEAEHQTITDIKQEVDIPIIANGDICTPERAREVMTLTGADGVMIGRAAQGRPWLLGQIAHYLHTGEFMPDPSPEMQRTILIGHIKELHQFYGERTGVCMARKHIAWYSKGRRQGAEFRRHICRITHADEQLRQVEQFFSLDNGELAA